ncbi:hypothetical protein K9M59_04125 [Candidatus Gracilibacteria bacterium]|nr:hypothetical protein [Candidatus Gracilibacteria bacterium]MCF7819509.1 hypothetical protein [Candidatus Gracilibacteria bacterium]
MEREFSKNETVTIDGVVEVIEADERRVSDTEIRLFALGISADVSAEISEGGSICIDEEMVSAIKDKVAKSISGEMHQ